MGARTLAGEHDFCLRFPLQDKLEVCPFGLPLDAETVRLGIRIFGFSEAPCDKERISEGFDVLDPRFFIVVEPIFLTEPDTPEVVNIVAGLHVGVVDLDAGFELTDKDGMPTGVEERVALTGVEDLELADVGLAESIVGLKVGVETREDFDFAGRADFSVVGVAALVVFLRSPDDKGFLFAESTRSALLGVDHSDSSAMPPSFVISVKLDSESFTSSSTGGKVESGCA